MRDRTTESGLRPHNLIRTRWASVLGAAGVVIVLTACFQPDFRRECVSNEDCPARQQCRFSNCVFDDDTDEGCGPSEVVCEEQCVNPATDVAFCGGCEGCQALSNATAIACEQGACVYGCVAGFEDSNSDLSQGAQGDGCECDLELRRTEQCDGIDNDCDGEIDEGCDDDNDGFCDTALLLEGSPAVCPRGGGDCDDDDANIHPDAVERCDDLDNNCEGGVDEGCDDDNDGFCDATLQMDGSPQICPLGGGDCNDRDAAIHPDAVERCDDLDNNCDEEIDEGCDDDNDGFCDINVTVIGNPLICPLGGGDCDDDEVSTFPGNFESCDGVDNNCVQGVDELCCANGEINTPLTVTPALTQNNIGEMVVASGGPQSDLFGVALISAQNIFAGTVDVSGVMRRGDALGVAATPLDATILTYGMVADEGGYVFLRGSYLESVLDRFRVGEFQLTSDAPMQLPDRAGTRFVLPNQAVALPQNGDIAWLANLGGNSDVDYRSLQVARGDGSAGPEEFISTSSGARVGHQLIVREDDILYLQADLPLSNGNFKREVLIRRFILDGDALTQLGSPVIFPEGRTLRYPTTEVYAYGSQAVATPQGELLHMRAVRTGLDSPGQILAQRLNEQDLQPVTNSTSLLATGGVDDAIGIFGAVRVADDRIAVGYFIRDIAEPGDTPTRAELFVIIVDDLGERLTAPVRIQAATLPTTLPQLHPSSHGAAIFFLGQNDDGTLPHLAIINREGDPLCPWQ